MRGAIERTVTEMEQTENKVVLCGANSYEQKYYFNEQFKSLPESIRQELQIMCVLYTEDIGGVLVLEFEEDGTLEFKVTAPEEDTLNEMELKQHLHQVIGRLFEKNIMLMFTGHLSDRELYCLIARDILPAQEKKVMLPEKYLRWQCLDIEMDEESWLRYYATEEDRERWHFDTGLKLPPRQRLPFPRHLPQHGNL